MDIRVAVLIDGSFFIRRVQFFYRKYFSHCQRLTAEQTVDVLQRLVTSHLTVDNNGYQHLYRIFFYDALPLDIKVHLPIKINNETNHRVIDFAKTDENLYRKSIIQQLKKQRKVALRMGIVKHSKEWKLNTQTLKRLLKGDIEFSELTNDDFIYDIRQKGVDIKLGVDIATLAFKKQVDKIVLIAGDSDFVPVVNILMVWCLLIWLPFYKQYYRVSLIHNLSGGMIVAVGWGEE